MLVWKGPYCTPLCTSPGLSSLYGSLVEGGLLHSASTRIQVLSPCGSLSVESWSRLCSLSFCMYCLRHRHWIVTWRGRLMPLAPSGSDGSWGITGTALCWTSDYSVKLSKPVTSLVCLTVNLARRDLRWRGHLPWECGWRVKQHIPGRMLPFCCIIMRYCWNNLSNCQTF